MVQQKPNSDVNWLWNLFLKNWTDYKNLKSQFVTRDQKTFKPIYRELEKRITTLWILHCKHILTCTKSQRVPNPNPNSTSPLTLNDRITIVSNPNDQYLFGIALKNHARKPYFQYVQRSP